MNTRVLLMVVLLPWTAAPARGQSDRVSWRRSDDTPDRQVVIFHSSHVVNLPTAATYQKGSFQFEIAHRFENPVSSGYETFYGLDGPAHIRLGLGYAVTDDISVTLARTNLRGQVELQLKWGFFRPRAGVPVQLALLLGGGWDTHSSLYPADHHRSFQYYAQFILNTRAGRVLSLGIVPSYVYNSIPQSEDVEHALTLGVYAQAYLTGLMSLLAEWNVIEPGYYLKYDALSVGLELETGGHFFKLIFSNSTQLNTGPFLPGTTHSARPRDWRFGFNITRLLRF